MRIWIGSAWNAATALIAFAGTSFAGTSFAGTSFAFVGFVVARCAAWTGLGAANCSTSLPCAVASGTFPVLAMTTATQCTTRRAVRSQASC